MSYSDLLNVVTMEGECVKTGEVAKRYVGDGSGRALVPLLPMIEPTPRAPCRSNKGVTIRRTCRRVTECGYNGSADRIAIRDELQQVDKFNDASSFWTRVTLSTSKETLKVPTRNSPEISRDSVQLLYAGRMQGRVKGENILQPRFVRSRNIRYTSVSVDQYDDRPGRKFELVLVYGVIKMA